MPEIRVGQKLYGYCGGIFGDLYGDPGTPHHVEAIGADWVVIRVNNGGVAFAECHNPNGLLEYALPPVQHV